MVALEAMAAGKPVIATRVGGLPEVLADAEAWLVAPDEPVALAEAISGALARLAREPQYGWHNRECARKFSVAHMVDSYLTIYGN